MPRIKSHNVAELLTAELIGRGFAPIFGRVVWGLAARASIEWMLYNSLSAKIEYLHLQSANTTSTIAAPRLGGGVLTDSVKATNILFVSASTIISLNQVGLTTNIGITLSL